MNRAVLSVILVCTVVAAGIVSCSNSSGPARTVTVRATLAQLAITEINYHPSSDGATDADAFEFIEFKNRGESSIDLTDVAIVDGVDYTFPSGTSLAKGEFLVLASNSEAFTNRYGFSPFGVYTGKLNNAGETISLKDLDADEKFLEITYGDAAPWPAEADGNGRTIVPLTLGETGDLSSASHWRASFRKYGSPGKDDPGTVLINEALTHTDLPKTDAIELYNPNGYDVDIGGWYLTDKKSDPMKFRIPDGTLIPANGYRVFNATEFNATPSASTAFLLNAHGEEVYLFSDSTGTRGDGYYHGFSFGEIENGVSFGRYVSSDGREQFVPQKALTLGAANAGPLAGPIVISEIMYHPSTGGAEFVEIKNIGAQTVPLYDTACPADAWKIGGLGFTFPAGISLQGGALALVISDSTSADDFRTRYSIPADVQIFTTTGVLSNSGETITLLKAEEPYVDSTSMQTVVPSMIVDKVDYSSGNGWPDDSTGLSLRRVTPGAFGNDPANWDSGTPTPGH
jgi:hypothetical protein